VIIFIDHRIPYLYTK